MMIAADMDSPPAPLGRNFRYPSVLPGATDVNGPAVGGLRGNTHPLKREKACIDQTFFLQ